MEYKLKRNLVLNLASVLIVNLFWVLPLQACTACFYGDPTQKTIVAAQWGVMTLLIVVLCVLSAFITFFIRFNKRAQLLNKANQI